MTPAQRTDFVLKQVQEARKEMDFATYAKMAAGIWTALDAATRDAEPPALQQSAGTPNADPLRFSLKGTSDADPIS